MDINIEQKWRLILGKSQDQEQSDPLDGQSELQSIDQTLDQLYQENPQGGLGNSSPKVNKWLGDIRKYFPSSVVQIMQKDAIDRLGLQQMLLEPELLSSMEVDINLVATLLTLSKAIPQKTKETARLVVQRLVNEILQRLQNPLREAVLGALSKSIRNHRPRLQEINWHRTIQRNLRHYQADYKTIIPQNLIGYGRKGQALRDVVLCIDQSGSMASSVVYSSVFGAVLASLPALSTQMVVFDTQVVDLTPQLKDPVDVLFGTQLGGGTDINKALAYVEKIISNPSQTILIVVSDLYEGGNTSQMRQRFADLQKNGVQVICLLALDDNGSPAYDRNNAQFLNSLDIPVFACTPDLFPSLIAAAIQKRDFRQWMNLHNIPEK